MYNRALSSFWIDERRAHHFAFDAAAPDDLPGRLEQLSAIEACHSVAGDENYILKIRAASPVALEELLQQIRTLASVSTRTTIVLSTPYENRPPTI